MRRDPITILMPCLSQKREFFFDAMRSVIDQTSGDWRLLVIVDKDSPAELREWIASFDDPRIETLVSDYGFGRALNLGMRHARTAYLSLLLSDDRYDVRAIEVLQRHIAAAPDIDFFYSSRREIDADGRRRGPIQKSPARVTVEAFETIGSPVKHLLCWRRLKGIACDGMDEGLLIGCDDYDFPWRMLDAGCRFRAIRDCLYEYRVHHTARRIITHSSLRDQLKSLGVMFGRHGVSHAKTCAYLQRAIDTYLIKEIFFDFEGDWRERVSASCYREAGTERLQDFLGTGYKQRHFFPHRVYLLPKAGIDGLKLAQRMCGIDDPGRLAQLVLFGLPPAIDGIPAELFFDNAIQWHQQHYGRLGQVASANIAVEGDRMFGMVYVSDLVQRISRSRAHKTLIEARFKGWHRLLLNALMNVALDRGLRYVHSPTAALAMTHTDPARTVGAPLFVRVYDTALQEQFVAERDGPWWRLDVAANCHRIVLLDKGVDVAPHTKTIGICHDIERGYGHRTTAPELAARADRSADAALDRMLEIEWANGVRATYSVVGIFFDEVRARIERAGHTCAFHSYDHPVTSGGVLARVLRRLKGRARQDQDSAQLERCRLVDYRLKGYRPPQSRLTRGLSDRHLSFHNFEWLASSAWSLGFQAPRMENGIAKIPILFDDYEMFRYGVPFETWRRKALDLIDTHTSVVFSLHDCYADLWLPHYADLLRAIRDKGCFRTLDEIAADLALAHARWV
jgi:glycosyltransferase involved in cell wall biosynthesis